MKKGWIFLTLILLMIFAFGCGGSQWKDGTYSGGGEGLQDDITVEVTVAGGKITKVDVVEQRESPGVSEPALEQIPERILEKQSTEVDVVSGVSYTSEGIIQAVEDALSKAK